MKKVDTIGTGISGCTIELSLSEMIVLKGLAEECNNIAKDDTKQSYSPNSNAEKKALLAKCSVILHKMTGDVISLNAAADELFAEPITTESKLCTECISQCAECTKGKDTACDGIFVREKEYNGN